MTEIVPPLRQAMIASRTAIGRSDSSRHRLLGAVVHVLESVAVRFQADGVDARVRAATGRHLRQRLGHAVDLFVVDGLGAALVARHLQPVVEAVDRDHPLRAEQIGALDREQPDRSAAPDRDGVARL